MSEIEDTARTLLRVLGKNALGAVRDYAEHLEKDGNPTDAARWGAIADVIESTRMNGSAWPPGD